MFGFGVVVQLQLWEPSPVVLWTNPPLYQKEEWTFNLNGCLLYMLLQMFCVDNYQENKSSIVVGIENVLIDYTACFSVEKYIGVWKHFMYVAQIPFLKLIVLWFMRPCYVLVKLNYINYTNIFHLLASMCSVLQSKAPQHLREKQTRNSTHTFWNIGQYFKMIYSLMGCNTRLTIVKDHQATWQRCLLVDFPGDSSRKYLVRCSCKHKLEIVQIKPLSHESNLARVPSVKIYKMNLVWKDNNFLCFLAKSCQTLLYFTTMLKLSKEPQLNCNHVNST